jgi:hypothetical protein
MRFDIGCADARRRIGQAAHDALRASAHPMGLENGQSEIAKWSDSKKRVVCFRDIKTGYNN